MSGVSRQSLLGHCGDIASAPPSLQARSLNSTVNVWSLPEICKESHCNVKPKINQYVRVQMNNLTNQMRRFAQSAPFLYRNHTFQHVTLPCIIKLLHVMKRRHNTRDSKIV